MQVQNLGYVVVQSTDISKWESYGTEVVGMMKSTSMPDNSSLYLKMDQRAFRYQVVTGDYDGLLFAGWDLGSEAAFNEGLAELKSKDIAFEKIEDADTLAARSVSGLARLADPSGNQFELYWATDSQADDGVAFSSPLVKKFITTATDGSDMGLGHVVLHAPTDFEGVHDFYNTLFGFKDSDITKLGPDGAHGVIYFMHCNPRHHSLALWNWGAPTPETEFKPSPESKAPGCVHLMAEVETRDEVDACLKRVEEREIMIISSLGEHINDEMTSFYMLSPGMFAIEFGHSGIEVGADWETTHNTEASKWGHEWAG
jgi:3,4-dihydroxy-9,10-secoandrosta-1,3,5(10)-triene-9,17-dione 4,5-dioxygenase